MRRKHEVKEEAEQQNEAAPRSQSTLKYVRYLLLLVMLMVALVFLFSNRDQINGDNFRRLMAKIDIGISGSEAEAGELFFNNIGDGATVAYKDGFAHATVEKLIITDKKGTEFQNVALGFRKPVIAANSRYVMVYDSGGTGITVADSFSVVFETHLENPIISAKMNSNGSLAVVTEGEGYLAKVYVFDSRFREIYRYRSLNRYILDAAISKDEKYLAVSALNIEGADITSEILCFKTGKEKIAWSAAFDESPCVRLSMKENGTICALFEWGVASLNQKGEEIGRYRFDNQVLQCYNIDDPDVNVFAVSAAENGDTTVIVCNHKGKVKDQLDLDFYALQLDYCDRRIAVRGNRKCAVYNASGKCLWEDEPDQATDILFMGKNAVVVVSETKCVYNAI